MSYSVGDLRKPVEMNQDWYDKSLGCYVFSEDGRYRTSLGTCTCVVCRHYNFLRDDTKEPISFTKYKEETGHKVGESDFWIKKATIAKVQCPICGALYLAHCYGHSKELWLQPYNLSFYHSFAEHPLKADVRLVDENWLTRDKPAPHLTSEPKDTSSEEDKLNVLRKSLEELKRKRGRA